MQVTRVRSTKLDSWTKGDARVMECVGNKVANLYWEHQLISTKRTYNVFDDNRVDYVKQKYVLKSFVKKGAKNPVDIVIERNYNISQEDLIDVLNGGTQEVAPKTEKVERKKFEVKRTSKPKPVEDLDLLNFDDNTKHASMKTNMSSKVDNKDLFDLDLKFESHSTNTDTKIKHKPHNNDDMFFLDLTDNGNQLRKVHSDLDDHKTHDNNNKNVYNIHNVNIFNAAPTNIINSMNAQPQQQQNQSDKYSVFDVYKLYNTPAYRY